MLKNTFFVPFAGVVALKKTSFLPFLAILPILVQVIEKIEEALCF